MVEDRLTSLRRPRTDSVLEVTVGWMLPQQWQALCVFMFPSGRPLGFLAAME